MLLQRVQIPKRLVALLQRVQIVMLLQRVQITKRLVMLLQRVQITKG